MSSGVRALLVVALLPGCNRSSRTPPPSPPKDASSSVDAPLASSGLFWAEPLPVRQEGTIEVAVSGDGSVGLIAWGSVDSSGEQVVLGQRPVGNAASDLGVFAVRAADGNVWVRLAESNLFPLGLELIDGVLITGAGPLNSRFTWQGGPEWSAALASTTMALRIAPAPQGDAVLAFEGATHERDASYVAETFGSIGDRVFAGVSHVDPGRRIAAWEGTVQAWRVDFPRSNPEVELWGTELAGNEVVACLAASGDKLKLDGLPSVALSGDRWVDGVAVWFSAERGRAVAARALKRRTGSMDSCSGFTAVQAGAIVIEGGEVQLFRREGSPPETLGSLGSRELRVLETDGADQIVTAEVQGDIEKWRDPDEQWTVQVFDTTRRTVRWTKTFPNDVKILSLAIHGDVLAMGGERRSEFEIEPGVTLIDPTGGNRGFVAAYRLPPRIAQ